MLPAALVVLALLLLPVQAASASPLNVQRDCADSDSFERKHSRGDLQATLPKVQADLAEYGTCRQMILAALAAMKKKGTGGGDGAAAIDPDLNGDGVVTPKEKRIAKKLAKELREKRSREIAAVSDDLIQDDAATASGGGDGGGGNSSLPIVLLVVALLCAATGGGLWYASKRNPSVANALRRVPLPFRNG